MSYVDIILCWAVLSHSVMSDSVTPWTVAHQALLSVGFSGQEYWSRLPFPSPGDLPNPGIELTSPALAGKFFTTSPTWEALSIYAGFRHVHIIMQAHM